MTTVMHPSYIGSRGGDIFYYTNLVAKSICTEMGSTRNYDEIMDSLSKEVARLLKFYAKEDQPMDIEVIKIHSDHTNLDSIEADMIDDYIDLMNGIVYDCWNNHGFSQGWRNTIAVDLTVGAYKLGLDPIDVLDKFIELNLIDPKDDDENTFDRVHVVMGYWRSFDWEWMIDADTYAGIGKDSHEGIMPLRFQLA